MEQTDQLQWFKTKTENNQTVVFDPLRQRYCALTPEEKVRQHILRYLVETCEVPSGLLAVEYSIKVNALTRRCDAVVFSRAGEPVMIVECKAQTVAITQKVLEQALRYFSGLPVQYLLLTNGLNTFCFKVSDKGFKTLTQIPKYPMF